ncbi:TniB family NTP-binding protein [Rhizobium mesosinicum]|uniref:TniB family NTP-binding protein n=1 Tax=Rhizobium mesosinicum TaxID=335017 RepID=A0ABS7GPB2_9HYPH|nr:TniB family NTP-binding protein [Rhizobium mesosinicum]MBW9051163.1 TniB family NTP-binding protein [Rhizobium mesosinicum]
MTEYVHTPAKTGLDHLRANVSQAVADKAALINKIDTWHVDTRYDDLFRLEIDRMLASIIGNNAQEGYAVAVVGKSGAGKSHTIGFALDRHPAFAPFDDGYGNRKQIFLKVRTPAKCSTKALGIEILLQAGYPIRRTTITEIEVWRLVREQLQRREIRIIHLDETQHVLKEKDLRGRTHTQNTIKSLMQNIDWPIWLIMSGIPDMLQLVENDTDQQMGRRTRVLHVGEMDDSDIPFLKAVMKAVAAKVGYKLAFPITANFMSRLLHAGIYRQGMLIQLIKMSVESAIWDEKTARDKSVLHSHFVDGYRRLCNCADGTNVFLIENWADIVREVDDEGKLSHVI